MYETPVRPKAADGMYPRCVWCNGEIYGPAVWDYSHGCVPCGSVSGCGKRVPPDYIPYSEDVENEMDAAIREINAIDDDDDRNHMLVQFGHRYGPYLMGRQ